MKHELIFDSVVFVHGFTGHPVRTWRHESASVAKNPQEDHERDGERPSKFRRLSSTIFRSKGTAQDEKVFWPLHLLPITLPTARIFVYGYDTKIRNPLEAQPSQDTVYDFASDFLQSLEDPRRAQPLRPLVFVAHSLGGIIVKETLRQAYSHRDLGPAKQGLYQIYESTAAIMFFGTPHNGADPRGFREMIIEKLSRAIGITVNEQIVHALLPNSERLKELRDSFSPMASRKKWLVFSFQEQYGVRAIGGRKASISVKLELRKKLIIEEVVEDSSSCIGDARIEMVRSISNHHMGMCRFSGIHDVEYQKVSSAFKSIREQMLEGLIRHKSPGS